MSISSTTEEDLSTTFSSLSVMETDAASSSSMEDLIGNVLNDNLKEFCLKKKDLLLDLARIGKYETKHFVADEL